MWRDNRKVCPPPGPRGDWGEEVTKGHSHFSTAFHHHPPLCRPLLGFNKIFHLRSLHACHSIFRPGWAMVGQLNLVSSFDVVIQWAVSRVFLWQYLYHLCVLFICASSDYLQKDWCVALQMITFAFCWWLHCDWGTNNMQQTTPNGSTVVDRAQCSAHNFCLRDESENRREQFRGVQAGPNFQLKRISCFWKF